MEIKLHDDGAISMKQGVLDAADFIKVHPEDVDEFWAAVFAAANESVLLRRQKERDGTA